jgi:hypothetical protein
MHSDQNRRARGFGLFGSETALVSSTVTASFTKMSAVRALGRLQEAQAPHR